MSLTSREIELIEKTVESTIETLMKTVIPNAFKAHIQSCPYGVALFKGKWMVIGALIVGGLATKGAFPLIEKLWGFLNGAG